MAIVEINGQEVEMVANAATPVWYERIFHQDLMLEQNRISRSINKEAREVQEGEEPEVTEDDMKANVLTKRLAFVMAMQAANIGTEDNLLRLTEVDHVKWLSQFSSVYALEEATEDIWTVYSAEEKPTAETKKEPAPQTDQ